jgi:hypothetical protein
MADLIALERQMDQGLTVSGRRWEQLQREYSWLANEKYYQEYPEHRPAKEISDGIR